MQSGNLLGWLHLGYGRSALPLEAKQELHRPRKLWLLHTGIWTISGAGSPRAQVTPVYQHLQAMTRGSLPGATMILLRQLSGFAPGAVGRVWGLAGPVGKVIHGMRAGSVQSELRAWQMHTSWEMPG